MNTTVDVHTHFIPQSYIDALSSAGISAKEVGFPLQPWNTQARLELQDKNGIQTEMLSLSSPGLRFFDAKKAPDLCRHFNDELAELVKQNPTRFGGLFTLPLPDVDGSLAEIERVYDQLGADGIILMTNYDGLYPGSYKFAPVLEELNRRKAVVFLHPTEAASNAALTFGFPAPMVEYPAETTRTIIDLLDSEALSHFADVRWIASHGGGTLPLLIKRIQELFPWKRGQDPDQIAGKLEREIASVYWDLAIVSYPAPLAAITKSHPADKLLMGFDLPFYPEAEILPSKHNLSNFEGLSEQDKHSIDYGTAHELFPRLKVAVSARK